MIYKSKFLDPISMNSSCLAIGIYQGTQQDKFFKKMDVASNGVLKKILKTNDLSCDPGSSQLLYDINGISADRIVLIGLGKKKDLDWKKFLKSVEAVIGIIKKTSCGDLSICLPEVDDLYNFSKEAITKIEEMNYRYKTTKNNSSEDIIELEEINILANKKADLKKINKGISHGCAISEGMTLTKDLSNLPGNICTPTYLANQAKILGKGVKNLKVKILEEKHMEELNMGALLSVSQGSREPAKFIVFEYKAGRANAKPVALVGKGITFDSGGISIKPSGSMDEMKYDMCGAASVFGVIKACISMKLPINIIGVIPASENLPDGNATKPGDVVTSMSGQTIEILNTDAEGRLVLCDALTYTEKYKPSAVIDMATLTGACIVALGHQASGLMSNDDNLAQEIIQAGEESNDRSWRLPLWDDYQSQLDSNFADMANIGGRSAGTITAACFLSRFTQNLKWAHLDIAGTAWKSGPSKGATGRPVPLLMQFLMKRCKQIR